MAELVSMIALSPTMEEGTLAEWRVSEGDTVSEGDVIADVETDKATMEMESWYDGTILKIVVGENDSVAVGDPIAIIGEAGEDISDLEAQIESGDAPAAEPERAAAGEGADEEPDAERPSESSEEAAPEEGPAAEEEPAQDATTDAAPTPGPAADASETEGRLRASPLARRIAAEEEIDLDRVEGSGPSGRIIRRDVEAYEETSAPEATAPTPADIPEHITQAPDVPGEEVPLSQMRKTIAERLGASWRTTPHFALTVDIDMTQAMEFRSTLNEQLESAGRDQTISVNDLIVKACADSLRSYPEMNVSYQGDHVVQFDAVHVGFAVAVEDGLVTPTIRDADEKSLGKISDNSKRLAEKARNRELQPEDYADGTFTVSNLGMYGIDHFMAVINPPQAAILACGAVRETPVAEDGELFVGTRMKITLSCDHRAVDGAMGAEFLDEVKTALENPVLLTV